MADRIKPHPLATLFPELPPEEMAQLAGDIKARGQLEPIILYRGLILDGHNRYKACQIAGVKPRTEEFDPKAARRSPSEFVLSRNLRRRHLSVGQKAAIALEWAEQTELSPAPDKNRGRGRPAGTLTETAKEIGINRQRVFEVRQVREADPALYQKVKDGSLSLNTALAEISPQSEIPLDQSDLDDTGSVSQGRDWSAKEEAKVTGQHRLFARLGEDRVRRVGGSDRSTKNAMSSITKPPSPKATEKALIRIKEILGTWFYGEVKGGNLIPTPEEIVQFAKLSDAQMREVGSLLKKGWTFRSAFQEVIEGLTPDDQIRTLHTRAVANGGNSYLSSIGNFGHFVAWGPGKDKVLAKLKDAWERLSVPR